MSAVPAPAAAAEGAKVRAAGHPLVLSDGTVALIRFGFGQLLEVEARFGSVMRYTDALDGSVMGPIFTAVAETVSIMTGKQIPAVVPLLEITKVAAYQRIIIEAWTEAMPPPRPEAVEDPKDAGPGGPSSITSGPSATGEATPTSGA